MRESNCFSGKNRRKRVTVFFLVFAIFVTNCVSLWAATYGEGLTQPPETAANAWQVASGLYEGNNPVNKTTVSDDGMIRIQKNVVPTDNENIFQVYLSVDAKKVTVETYETVTTMLDLSSLDYYVGGTGNGFPKKNNDVRTGNGTLNPGVQGGEKEIVFKPHAPNFTIQMWYNGEIIATQVLQLCVPNSVLYVKIEGVGYVALENILLHGNTILFGDPAVERQPQEDGTYLVPVYLTDMAYDALHSTSVVTDETTVDSVIAFGAQCRSYITDPMGAYIVYDGAVNADIKDPQPPAESEAGTTVNWALNPKAEADITKSDPVVTVVNSTYTDANGDVHNVKTTTTEQWYLNVSEIVYNVHLDVSKPGFVSGAVYGIDDRSGENGSTVLNYYYDSNGDGEEELHNLAFPTPEVTGTLYDFSFNKVDEETPGNILSGAEFTLVDEENNEWVADGGSSNGNWKYRNLPSGRYTLTETKAPAGYSRDEDKSWILNIGYTEDLKDGAVNDHTYDNQTGKYIFIGNNDATTGQWNITNTADIYKVTYLVTDDAVYGRPDGVSAPADTNEYHYGDTVTVKDVLESDQKYAMVDGERKSGYWTFTGWGTGNFQITESTTLYGKWKFTENYTLSYEVADDVLAGSPGDVTLPDKIEGIEYGETRDLADDLSTEWNTSTGKNDGGTPGFWRFVGWSTTAACNDEITDIEIIKNTTVYGKWEFVPDYVDVTVNKVWEDGNFVNRPDSVDVQLYRDGIEYNDIVSLNAGNSWTYTWEDLDNNHIWTVDEVNVPAGYIKDVEQNGNIWTITNYIQTQPVPHTGDNMNFSLLVVMMILSGLAVIGVIAYGKKKKII
jgi:LPXTG-motif cell wall-anchored protein